MTKLTQTPLKKSLLLPDIDWVKIPAGEFIYGENESQQKLALESFFISRYLITHSQYQTFIDADGYQKERWWQDLKQPAPKETRWPQPNRPREKVDWYEAVAFTRWLSEQLGLDIRLPTEQQWEKAARGTDGRKFPWGKSFHTGDANVNDSSAGEHNLRETTAVGLYLHRGSPYEVMDMAGNLWEWCLNKYNSPEDIGTNTSGEIRVVRGGSWGDLPEFARCAFRFRGSPGFRDYDFGFRVVCSSPFTGH